MSPSHFHKTFWGSSEKACINASRFSGGNVSALIEDPKLNIITPCSAPSRNSFRSWKGEELNNHPNIYRVAHEKPARRLVDQRGSRSRTLSNNEIFLNLRILALIKVTNCIHERSGRTNSNIYAVSLYKISGNMKLRFFKFLKKCFLRNRRSTD